LRVVAIVVIFNLRRREMSSDKSTNGRPMVSTALGFLAGAGTLATTGNPIAAKIAAVGTGLAANSHFKQSAKNKAANNTPSFSPKP